MQRERSIIIITTFTHSFTLINNSTFKQALQPKKKKDSLAWISMYGALCRGYRRWANRRALCTFKGWCALRSHIEPELQQMLRDQAAHTLDDRTDCSAQHAHFNANAKSLLDVPFICVFTWLNPDGPQTIHALNPQVAVKKPPWSELLQSKQRKHCQKKMYLSKCGRGF